METDEQVDDVIEHVALNLLHGSNMPTIRWAAELAHENARALLKNDQAGYAQRSDGLVWAAHVVAALMLTCEEDARMAALLVIAKMATMLVSGADKASTAGGT